MSAEARAALAGQVETVAGLSCTPYYRQTTKAGDAMVRMASISRDDSGFGFMVTWQVVLILPSDFKASEKYLEEKIDDLIAAVGEEMIVTGVTPQELVFDNGTSIPAVVIEGAREKE